MADEPGGFVSRWSRRKEQARSGVEVAPLSPSSRAAAAPGAAIPVPTPAVVPDILPAVEVDRAAAAELPAPPPLPTMADVALLSRESDYARFVTAGVDVGVKRAAMKKLFTDPHFNVMDGLDTYIADYGLPDPIPPGMLRQMIQSRVLGLFDDDPEGDDGSPGAEAAAGSPAPTADADVVATPLTALTEDPRHDDTDLRLQQDDDAGRAGAGGCARA